MPGLLLKMTDKLAVTADTLRPLFLPPAAAVRRIINELSFCLLVMLEAARLTKTAGSCVRRGIVTWDTNLLLEFTSLERWSGAVIPPGREPATFELGSDIIAVSVSYVSCSHASWSLFNNTYLAPRL